MNKVNTMGILYKHHHFSEHLFQFPVCKADTHNLKTTVWLVLRLLRHLKIHLKKQIKLRIRVMWKRGMQVSCLSLLVAFCSMCCPCPFIKGMINRDCNGLILILKEPLHWKGSQNHSNYWFSYAVTAKACSSTKWKSQKTWQASYITRITWAIYHL